jgi:hypothetical protein
MCGLNQKPLRRARNGQSSSSTCRSIHGKLKVSGCPSLPLPASPVGGYVNPHAAKEITAHIALLGHAALKVFNSTYERNRNPLNAVLFIFPALFAQVQHYSPPIIIM